MANARVTMFTERYGYIPYLKQFPARIIRIMFPPISQHCEMPCCTNLKTGYLARLVYDHCHECGCIRGTICGYCNRDLGRYEKNIPLLGIGNTAFDEYRKRCPCREET